MPSIHLFMCCRRKESSALCVFTNALRAPLADQPVPSPPRQRDLPVAFPGNCCR
jgi:hypothetical protein